MTPRLTTDEEVGRWRITPRPFEADPEDALTRLAQDFWAVTHSALTEGMETTAEERAEWLLDPFGYFNTNSPNKIEKVSRILRDFDCLTADLATAKRERDEDKDSLLKQIFILTGKHERAVIRAETAEADNLRLRQKLGEAVDPELVRIAGKPIDLLDAVTAGDREFDPTGGK